jgi:hypothetical protein
MAPIDLYSGGVRPNMPLGARLCRCQGVHPSPRCSGGRVWQALLGIVQNACPPGRTVPLAGGLKRVRGLRPLMPRSGRRDMPMSGWDGVTFIARAR